ncbi:MAG: hypothetical protein J0L92_07810 [Deltaproteobacteria bacterium]|nr:hypothetical protein [Deltaproteobacteria bacterium]
MHLYELEDLDASLPLVPLAARRALDRAEIKVGLEAWTALALDTRCAITTEGSREVVDAARVRALLAGVPSESHDAWPEPSSQELPPRIAEVLPALTLATWSSLRGLDRWVVSSFVRRDKHDALRALARELREPQLTPRRREE